MKDRSPEGYQQLLDFVEKAKSHAAANPGKAFAMDFQFKSSESLVVDYYEETHEAAMISTKGGQESEQISHYKQSTVSARRVVYSQTFQVSGMLMGLGEVLADLKAGVKPEADKALEGKDKAPELPKPGSATADLLDELLEDLDKPLEVEIPNVIKDKKDHPLHPDHPVFDENPGLLTRQKDRGYVPVVADEDRQAKGNPKPLTELVVGYA